MNILTALMVLVVPQFDANRQNTPNVVLIASDDQGFTDFGFMGHPIVQTPYLDTLVDQSAFFPNGYVPTSLCRPSLVTMLTGLYPHQHQVHFNDPPDKKNRQQAERFIREVSTLPRWLATNGYVSFQTGKFWEGHYSNAGFIRGMTHGDPARGGRHGDEGLEIGRKGMQPIYDFIDSCGDKPFFLWYAPFIPHTPYTPPKEFIDKYKDNDLHPRVRQYYAMCSWFDHTVGELVQYLDTRGLSDNTLIVFVVDNGWITNTQGQRPPYAPRSKRSPFEMGVRTPIFFRWANRIKPAQYDDLVSSIDLAPTILAACGVSPGDVKLPGVNLLPICEGKQPSLQREAVFGEIFEHDAMTLGRPADHLLYRWIRTGPWKLIDAHSPQEKDMLFNLQDDPDEQHNLLDEKTTLHADLQKRLDEWWKPGE